MPEISADYKTFTFRIKPGIYFADDPAFKGQKRELTAEDGFPIVDSARVVLRRNPRGTSSAVEGMADILRAAFAPLRREGT